MSLDTLESSEVQCSPGFGAATSYPNPLPHDPIFIPTLENFVAFLLVTRSLPPSADLSRRANCIEFDGRYHVQSHSHKVCAETCKWCLYETCHRSRIEF
ncbi:hypothetical protein FA15DRAFT_669317 [Coprinopsis marcescibilis]|uniref:Uncharacterized protein n=1 Tax=Coprinopsis marcescibilis TaxID=230819 RepID=A0A5C3KWC0_COPMA|nr:hypothetical protein FA15DRAFT_669317 [Coprinopsis marcescibilis]